MNNEIVQSNLKLINSNQANELILNCVLSTFDKTEVVAIDDGQSFRIDTNKNENILEINYLGNKAEFVCASAVVAGLKYDVISILTQYGFQPKKIKNQ